MFYNNCTANLEFVSSPVITMKKAKYPNGYFAFLVRETGLSSCYRKVHRTFLLNLPSNKLHGKFRATSSSPNHKNKHTPKWVYAYFGARDGT